MRHTATSSRPARNDHITKTSNLSVPVDTGRDKEVAGKSYQSRARYADRGDTHRSPGRGRRETCTAGSQTAARKRGPGCVPVYSSRVRGTSVPAMSLNERSRHALIMQQVKRPPGSEESLSLPLVSHGRASHTLAAAA